MNDRFEDDNVVISPAGLTSLLSLKLNWFYYDKKLEREHVLLTRIPRMICVEAGISKCTAQAILEVGCFSEKNRPWGKDISRIAQ